MAKNVYVAFVNGAGNALLTLPVQGHASQPAWKLEDDVISGLVGAVSIWNGPPPAWCARIVLVRSPYAWLEVPPEHKEVLWVCDSPIVVAEYTALAVAKAAEYDRGQWMVLATVSEIKRPDEWALSGAQVPAFFIDGGLHPNTEDKHAAQIACRVVDPGRLLDVYFSLMNPDDEVSFWHFVKGVLVTD